jgi:TPR repeat protein
MKRNKGERRMKGMLSAMAVLCLLAGACRTVDEHSTKQVQNGKATEDLAELQRKAKARDAEAQYELALRYTKGEGVAKDEKKASRLYWEAAWQNYMPALRALASQYENGEAASKSIGTTIWLYTKAAAQGDEFARDRANELLARCTEAAEKGDAEAQFQLATAYDRTKYESKGDSEENRAKAIEWFTKAAEQGLVKAYFALGFCYYNEGDMEKRDEAMAKAIEWFTKAAEQGDADAQGYLGICYSNGYGVKRDFEKAVEWYTKAIERGNTSSLNSFAYCYFMQAHYTPDVSLKNKYFQGALETSKKLAETGDENWLYMVGHLYEEGKGVEQDTAEAMKWYEKILALGDDDYSEPMKFQARRRISYLRKAAELPELTKKAEAGDVETQYELGTVYEKGEGAKVNLAEAAKWYTKAAEQGHAQAQFSLGSCYEEGKGVRKDIAKAVELYKKSAEQGNAQAQCNLGFCYDMGVGVEKNIAKAVELYRKSAEQGVALAQYYLGVCYAKGEGIGKDLAKAVEWYRKAAEQGDAEAQLDLGVCYENGEGVAQDKGKAMEWYRKAAYQRNEIAKSRLMELRDERDE